MNRRDWLVASAAVTGSALTVRFQRPKYSRDLRPPRSRVAVLHADQYSDKLDNLIYEGLRLFDLNVRGKSVLLKPNIVEYIPEKPINTDTQLIGAAAEGFLQLRACFRYRRRRPRPSSGHRTPGARHGSRRSTAASQDPVR